MANKNNIILIILGAFIIFLLLTSMVAFAVGILIMLPDDIIPPFTSSKKVTSEVTLRNPLGVNVFISGHSHTIGGTCIPLLAIPIIEDKGEVCVSIGNNIDCKDYSIFEEAVWWVDTKKTFEFSSCVPEGTHDVHITVTDENGDVIDEKTTTIIV